MSDYSRTNTISFEAQSSDDDFEPAGQLLAKSLARPQPKAGSPSWLIALGDDPVNVFDIGFSFATDEAAQDRGALARLNTTLQGMRLLIGRGQVVQGLVIAGETSHRRVFVLVEEHTDDAYTSAAQIQDLLFAADLSDVEVSVWALQGRAAKEVAQSLGTLL